MPPGGKRSPITVRAVDVNDASITHTFETLCEAGRFLQNNSDEVTGNARQTIKRYAEQGEVYCGYRWSLMERNQPANTPNVEQQTDVTEIVENRALDFVLDQTTGVSVRVTTETPKRVSVYDLITTITGTNNPYTVFTRLSTDYPEVLTNCEDFEFSGQGQRPTPVTDARGAVCIINVLPGQHAAMFRQSTAHLLVRYLGGDETLISEIQHNAAVQQALPAEHVMRMFGEAVEQEQQTTWLHAWLHGLPPQWVSPFGTGRWGVYKTSPKKWLDSTHRESASHSTSLACLSCRPYQHVSTWAHSRNAPRATTGSGADTV